MSENAGLENAATFVCDRHLFVVIISVAIIDYRVAIIVVIVFVRHCRTP